MLDVLSQLRQTKTPDSRLSSQLREYEISLDTIQEEITTFMTKLVASALPHDVADEIYRQLRIAHEYESISDNIENLERLDGKMKQYGANGSSKFHKCITELSDCTQLVLKEINTALRTKDQDALKEFASVRERVRSQIKALRSNKFDELTNVGVPPAATAVVLSILNSYVHLFSHFENIVETLSGEA